MIIIMIIIITEKRKASDNGVGTGWIQIKSSYEGVNEIKCMWTELIGYADFYRAHRPRHFDVAPV